MLCLDYIVIDYIVYSHRLHTYIVIGNLQLLYVTEEFSVFDGGSQLQNKSLNSISYMCFIIRITHIIQF